MENQPFHRLSVGETFKKIRKNKNYSQKFITNGIIGQSTYSKFERGKVDVSYPKFNQLLKRLDMNEEEFHYVMDETEEDERDLIIQSFFLLNHNDYDELIGIKDRIALYLEGKEDYVLQDIGFICEALILIVKDRDYQKAVVYANKVWGRLQKFDQWYLMEVRLLNTILFIFPLESLLEISNRMMVQLIHYNTRESRIILNNIQTNLSLVLIRNEEYALALEHLNELTTRFKEERNYYLLAIAYMRKGITLSLLEDESSAEYLEKAMQLVNAFDDAGLAEAFDDEISHYTRSES